MRIFAVAFVTATTFPLLPAVSEPIAKQPEPLSASLSSDLALPLQPDEIPTTRRLTRLELNTSQFIPQFGAVPRPARTVFLRAALTDLQAAGAPRVIKTSFPPEEILPPREAVPVPGVTNAEPLAASLPSNLVTEMAHAPGTPIEGAVLSEPLTVVISLKDQKLDVYRGLDRVGTTRISSGKMGYETLTGVFGILQKKREHYSNLYDNAPMPYMQRLTRSGTALHAGQVPNYPASHGCVRMPKDFAPKLFRITDVGGKVAMMNGRMVAPSPIVHPTLFEAKTLNQSDLPSAEGSLAAGVQGAARAAARGPSVVAEDSPRTNAPLRILVTRREQRDIAIRVQEILAAMGYLTPQNKFVGYLGEGTKKAIKAFEKDNGLPQRGRFTEAIAAKIYEAAGEGPLPDAYLFLRRGFSRIRHVPVTIKDPHKKLGTHLFTFMRPSDGSAPQWIGINLEGENSKSVLDRITIPAEMREEISEGLTSGATFIVADRGMHSSVLPDGDDFIVRTNDSPESSSEPEKRKVVAKPKKRVKPKKRAKKRVVRAAPKRRTVTKTRGFRLFRRRR
ncbi:MAG: L,D-transpeptidase family protein [Alphaproteobacteria bacterium]